MMLTALPIPSRRLVAGNGRMHTVINMAESNLETSYRRRGYWACVVMHSQLKRVAACLLLIIVPPMNKMQIFMWLAVLSTLKSLHTVCFFIHTVLWLSLINRTK